jgi:hypothetical protein
VTPAIAAAESSRGDGQRDELGHHEDFGRLVLPTWVPPDTSTFRPEATAACRKRAAWEGIVPRREELMEAVGLQHERSDVDRHVAAGDVGDDDVQPGAVGHRGVDEWRADVDPPSGCGRVDR